MYILVIRGNKNCSITRLLYASTFHVRWNNISARNSLLLVVQKWDHNSEQG